jgi:hypothetical protein
MSEEKTLEQLLTEQREAEKALLAAMEQEKKENEEARQIVVKAENRTRDALNVFNGLTKRIDVALQKMRESSPLGTAWREYAQPSGGSA